MDAIAFLASLLPAPPIPITRIGLFIDRSPDVPELPAISSWLKLKMLIVDCRTTVV
jgi:hypothetical protein